MINSSRCPRPRIPPRPPDMSLSGLKSVYHRVLLLITLLSFFGGLHVSAQPTASTSSPTSSASPASPQSTIVISGLPSLLNLPYLNSTNPTVQLELPTTSTISVTLNICSVGINASLLPTVLLSTASPPLFSLGTRSVVDKESGGLAVPNRRNRAGDTWMVEWDAGFANWTWSGTEVGVSMLIGIGTSTGTTVGSDDGNIVVQVGITGNGESFSCVISANRLTLSVSVPSHSLFPVAPLLGDTTSNSALLFSPLLLSSPHSQPSYPNYTLPPNQLILPDFPGIANLTSLSATSLLILVPTTSSPTTDGLDNSLCAVQSASTSTGALADPTHMLLNATPSWMDVGGEEGFRTLFVVGGLIAETNYTAWMVDENGGMSTPICLATKEGTSCGLFRLCSAASTRIRMPTHSLSILPMPTRCPHLHVSLDRLCSPTPTQYHRLD